MSVASKVAVGILYGIALIVVAVKLILPLILVYTGTGAVQIPVPTRFAKRFPSLTIYLFVVGGPLLFIALLAMGAWLVRTRR